MPKYVSALHDRSVCSKPLSYAELNFRLERLQSKPNDDAKQNDIDVSPSTNNISVV